MKATILDGSLANDTSGERIRKVLAGQLQAQGWDVQHIALREKTIGECAGDFFCWIRTPGVCKNDDDNRAIAEAIVGSSLLVYLSPIAFGGYSSHLKRMVDHQIQSIAPFFEKIGGETHHRKRYKRYADFLSVGWLDTPDARAETVFRHLVQRNAINFYAKTYVSAVVEASVSDRELQDSAENWLDDLQKGRSSPQVELPESVVRVGDATADIRRALLLVGSPKRAKSNSNSLGQYWFERLAAQSVQTKTIYVHTALRSPEETQELLDAVDEADLVALAFPVYVDSLPAPLIEALERIAAYRQGRATRPQSFAAIANSGFPEVVHNATALAICETFAQQAKFEWAGSLALGGGGVVDGQPLAQAGGRTLRIRAALDLAADALVRGESIPTAAQELLSKPIIPHWVYRLMGELGWRQQAKKYGARRSLRHRPYLETTPK